jgi:hypothetical protein
VKFLIIDRGSGASIAQSPICCRPVSPILCSICFHYEKAITNSKVWVRFIVGLFNQYFMEE